MTTQDKPAVGPLKAEYEMLYARAVVFATRDKPSTSYLQRRLQIGFNLASSLIERMEKEGLISKANSAGRRSILVPFTAPTAPADVSTKPLETNTSAEHVKETAKNEHVTAPVEAVGSEDKRRREITAVMSALDRFEDLAGRVTATQAEHVLASLSALRPQPSGETRDCPHGLHSVGSCSDCSVNRSMDDQPHAPVSRPGDGVEGERIDYLRRSRDGHARNAHVEFEKRVMATEALISAREALHQHYVDWDGEPEDAVPLQEARDECDRVLDAIAALTPPAEPVSRPSGEGETTQHTPCCWGRTSYSDEMAHCYCKPAGEGEREAVARLICYWSEPSTCHDAYCSATCRAVKPDAWVWKAADAILALIRPAAPGGGEAWAWLAAHPSMELGHCYGDEDDDPAWQVHERSGNRSDREWRLVASGPTPLEAVLAAIPASEGGEG